LSGTGGGGGVGVAVDIFGSGSLSNVGQGLSKYVQSSEQAQRIADFTGGAVELDEFGQTKRAQDVADTNVIDKSNPSTNIFVQDLIEGYEGDAGNIKYVTLDLDEEVYGGTSLIRTNYELDGTLPPGAIQPDPDDPSLIIIPEDTYLENQSDPGLVSENPTTSTILGPADLFGDIDESIEILADDFELTEEEAEPGYIPVDANEQYADYYDWFYDFYGAYYNGSQPSVPYDPRAVGGEAPIYSSSGTIITNLASGGPVRGYAQGGEVQMEQPEMSEFDGKITNMAIRVLTGQVTDQEHAMQIMIEFENIHGDGSIDELKAELAASEAGGQEFAEGGEVSDGMSDSIPAVIDGTEQAALSEGEFVVPADVVSSLGNGDTESGLAQLQALIEEVRMAKSGTPEQPPQINARQIMTGLG
jgi:hypothetical protein